MLRAAVLFALTSFAAPVMAAGSFACDGTNVLFSVIRTGPGPEAVSATLSVRRGPQVLTWDLPGDFVGGECLRDDRGQPMIVYQAYCGGAGCKDLANWGIVDPRSLREVLRPSDTNREKALVLIGWGLPRHIN